MHHLINVDFRNVTYKALLISVLSCPEFAFNIHKVAFGIVAAMVGDVVGEVAPNNDVVPVGLFDPIVVAVAVAF